MTLFSNHKCAQCETVLNLPLPLMGGATPKRCRGCRDTANGALRQFAADFREACADAVITSQEWQDIWARLQPSGVTHAEALEYIRQDALRFLDRLIDNTFADGIVTAEEEVYFRRMVSILGITPKDMSALRDKWEKAKARIETMPHSKPEAA